MTFDLTERQKEQRDEAASDAMHILAVGGTRSGKTFGFVRSVAVRALSAPRSRHLIARLHNIDVRQSVMMDTFPTVMQMCFPNVSYEINRSDQYAKIGKGSEIWFGGLDDKERVDKILGKEYATIYANETSQIAYNTILTLRTRLAQSCKKADGRPLALKAYYDLNPTTSSHWTHAEFIDGVTPGEHRPVERGSRAHIFMNPADNPHLPKEYVDSLDELPERLRKRFRDGVYLSEMPGALWTRATLDDCRLAEAPELDRIVIGVDPSGSDGVSGDSQGIIAMGKGIDGHGYLLDDASCRLSPAGWAARAVDLYHKHDADLMVAEANYGGAMVEAQIRSVDRAVNVRLVNASRGKHIRAEPVAALYETTESKEPTVHHVGSFPELEDQLSSFTTDGYVGSNSPDRADALVWAATELMLKDEPTAWVLTR